MYFMENKQKSLDSNKQFINNKSDSELNNLMVEFDNYESEEPEKDIIMELKKDPTLKEFDDKVTENISALKQKQETLEEVANKYASYNFDSSYLDIKDHFIAGYELAQERSYSEEDMNQYSDYVLMCSAEKTFKLPLSPKQWFKINK